MNKQREVIYGERRKILLAETPRELLLDYIDTSVFDNVEASRRDPKSFGSSLDTEQLLHWLHVTFPIGFRAEDLEVGPEFTTEELTERLMGAHRARLRGQGEGRGPGPTALAGTADHA